MMCDNDEQEEVAFDSFLLLRRHIKQVGFFKPGCSEVSFTPQAL